MLQAACAGVITLHSEQASGHWHAFWLLHYHAASVRLSVLLRPHLSVFLLFEFTVFLVTLYSSKSRFLLSLCLNSPQKRTTVVPLLANTMQIIFTHTLSHWAILLYIHRSHINMKRGFLTIASSVYLKG